MTAAVLPDYLLKVLEAEVNSVCWRVVERLCDLYSLDKNEVKSRLDKWMFTELDVKSDEKIKVVKCKPMSTVPVQDRCVARCYNKEVKDVTQCSKKAKMCGFCMTHYDLQRQDYLRYGTIHKPIHGHGPNFNVVKKVERKKDNP